MQRFLSRCLLLKCSSPLFGSLEQAAAARRAERRARGFQIQINLGRVNLRAIMQLLFMLVIMAPVRARGGVGRGPGGAIAAWRNCLEQFGERVSEGSE